MGSPPMARSRDTFRRRPGVVSGRGTLFQSDAGAATGESMKIKLECKLRTA